MKTSDNGLAEIIGHEGVCLSPYKDSVGVWTIGIGATRTEMPNIANHSDITMQEAFGLLHKSIKRYENALNQFINVGISQTMFDALASWCYNVGVGWVPKATVIRLINQGVTGAPLYDALMMFRSPPEITLRRKKEANLLAYGKYSNNGRALLFPVSSSGRPLYGKGKTINVWEYMSQLGEFNAN
jgi:lysozyme